MLGTKRVCRVRIAKDELEKMSKEDFHKSWLLQEQYVDYIEAKLNENTDHSELANLRESEEKLKQQQLEATRRENILVMRLTTKEQEVQEYAGQIQELKQAQVPTLTQLRSTLVDPAVNVMFDRMRKEIETLKARLEETQNELSAWKFTPDSNTGKRLMAKCRLLYQENEELGKMISSGRMAKLEGDLALQRTFSEEMKKSQSELDEFLLELDEDVEGMQSTIYYLQQQLRESKEHISKLQKENEKLSAMVANPSSAERNFLNNGNVDSSENKAITSPNGHLPSNNVSVNDINPKPTSPAGSDLNRTEGLSNQKPDKGTNSTQPWSPPPEPAEGGKKVDQSEPMNLTVEVESQRQDLTDSVAVSRQQQQSPQSSVNHQNQKPVENSVAAQPTVASARGSLHVEAYDSEQEAEPVVPSAPAATAREQHADASAASVTASDLTVKDRSPSVSPKKAPEQASKRTPESSGRVSRKRTRNTRSSSHAYVEEDSSACELPTVKRLRRRDIVVEQDITESDSKRTQLQMDAINDAEVQVAQTLATWAAAKQERKDSQVSSSSQDHISEAVGNGELRGGRVNENAT